MIALLLAYVLIGMGIARWNPEGSWPEEAAWRGVVWPIWILYWVIAAIVWTVVKAVIALAFPFRWAAGVWR